MKGYITIHRAIKGTDKGRLYKHPHTSRVWFDLLLEANYEDNKEKGFKRGEFPTSYATIANDLCLTVANVRTAIKKLEKLDMIEVKTSRKGTVIKIKNYDQYQLKQKDEDKKQEESKAEAKENQKVSAPETSRKKFTPPTVEEVEAYVIEKGGTIDPQTFVDHYEATGWMRGKNKIKDWRACVRTWEKSNREKGITQPYKPSSKPKPTLDPEEVLRRTREAVKRDTEQRQARMEEQKRKNEAYFASQAKKEAQ